MEDVYYNHQRRVVMPSKKKVGKKVSGYAKLWAYKFDEPPHFVYLYMWGTKKLGQFGCVHFGLDPKRLVRVEVKEL